MHDEAADDEVVEELLVTASPPSVWQALVDPGRRRHWWSYLELAPVAGSEFAERWTDVDGTPVLTSGSVLDVVPDRRLRLTWRDEGWPVPTVVEITLAPAESGTVVAVRHSGWGRLPDGLRLAEEHRAGWRVHLANLRRHLEG
ncbi:MAG: SRPBCC domain-containing protein [Actinobacteria bacterium]|nr:SRPBCC domain-containing protein [Actinomycetota bacterium]MBW3641613.1 SRPBCC domain-containing protein [Actinomycetota bacterium]